MVKEYVELLKASWSIRDRVTHVNALFDLLDIARCNVSIWEDYEVLYEFLQIILDETWGDKRASMVVIIPIREIEDQLDRIKIE